PLRRPGVDDPAAFPGVRRPARPGTLDRTLERVVKLPSLDTGYGQAVGPRAGGGPQRACRSGAMRRRTDFGFLHQIRCKVDGMDHEMVEGYKPRNLQLAIRSQ